MSQNAADRLATILDTGLEKAVPGNIPQAMDFIVDRLNDIASSVSQEEFRATLKPVCLAHPIRQICHQDPYTRRCFEKPRGYAGDAELIDFFYGYNGPRFHDTSVGAEIFTTLMRSSSCESVRYRRSLIGSRFDEVEREFAGQANILSVACGHLREAAFSLAATEQKLTIYALDHDSFSLGLVEAMYGNLGVKPVSTNIKSIVSGRFKLDNLAFVYSAGLYDYLGQSMANRLTKRMFDMLASGGKLLVANFAHGIRERGYMEGFMDWYLTYRTTEEVAAFASEIEPEQVAERRIFHDPQRNVIYLELRRR